MKMQFSFPSSAPVLIFRWRFFDLQGDHGRRQTVNPVIGIGIFSDKIKVSAAVRRHRIRRTVHPCLLPVI